MLDELAGILAVAVAMLSAAVCWPLHLVLDLLRA